MQFKHLFPRLADIINPVTLEIFPIPPAHCDNQENTISHDGQHNTKPHSDDRLRGHSHNDDQHKSQSHHNGQRNLYSQRDDRHHTPALRDDQQSTLSHQSHRFNPQSQRKPEHILNPEALSDALDYVIAHKLHPDSFLLGYSMGGRLALNMAVRHPQRAGGLILESTTAGIPNEAEREKRRKADANRAEKIIENFPRFLEEWESQEIFGASGPGQKLAPARETSRLKTLGSIQNAQDPDIMAQWLKGFGTGSMPSFWEDLNAITSPVLLITGALDHKFCDIAAKMCPRFPDARHETVPDAAHRVHIDAPDAYLSHIRSFIQSV